MSRDLTSVAIADEKELLGGILLNPEAIAAAEQFLDPSMFLLPVHQILYQGFRSLYQAGRGTDLISVIVWLSDSDQIHEIGGGEKIAELAEGCDRCYDYADISDIALDIRQYAKLRRISQQKAGRKPGLRPIQQVMEEERQRLSGQSDAGGES